MEIVVEFAKLLIPAGLVLYAMYLSIQSFLKKELENKLVDVKVKSGEIILPNRLQAYERIALFLERIMPENLILRLNDASYSAPKLQQILIHEIREEFNHNLSQQIYMSDEVWQLIKNTVEEYISLINQSANELKQDAKGIDLAKNIFHKMSEQEFNRINYALAQLKEEIQQLF
ncbi:MAG: hypothetical protein ACNS62_09875 [Candidatus Cyclobacteriaceae bacterium M3_2C_046]